MPAPLPSQFATNPAAALQSLAGASSAQQQEASVESMMLSNQMTDQYKAQHAPPPQTPVAQTQWPTSQPSQEQPLPQQMAQPAQPPPFRMTPVSSSTVDMVGYDQRAGQLHVRFKSGPDTYVHNDVPPQTFTGLLNAKSKGLFYANEVKGKFKYSKQKPIPPQL